MRQETSADYEKGQSLLAYLKPIQNYLNDPDVSDICINGPGICFIDRKKGWEAIDGEELTARYLSKLANAVSNFCGLGLGPDQPILSGQLPDGQRIQIIAPPVVQDGLLSITIRRPSETVYPFSTLVDSGLLSELRAEADSKLSVPAEVMRLHRTALRNPSTGNWVELFRFMVEQKLTIVFSGAMGSGKTTVMKSLMQFIPEEERLGTIQDALELTGIPTKNVVHMIYARNGNSIANVDAGILLASSLRMNFSRIFMSEIRGQEAYEYVINSFSGHPGSMTTIHANSAAEARQMIALRCLESEKGRAMPPQAMLDLIGLNVDVVLHCVRKNSPTEGKRHLIEDISFSKRFTPNE